jgi:hypothetical protein
MRDKLRALYYPDFWVEAPTLKKSILLFDEIHFMDRPSFMFGGSFGSVGAASPLRRYEKAFRDGGVPLYVHGAIDGPVEGELLTKVEADLGDLNFMTRFQEGLRVSPHFRNLHIQPGDYGQGETHETLFQKLAVIDLQQSRQALEVFNDPLVRHMDHTTPQGRLKILASDAALCSAKMSVALDVGARQAFAPLADASPYTSLLSVKYSRAVATSALVGGQILATDLSLAIFDELVPAESLEKLTFGEAIRYRKESDNAREAFLEHLLLLQTKLGQVPGDGDYAASISKIITTEVRPAAQEFRNKLDTIYEKLFGKIAGAAVAAAGSAVTWAGSSAAVQVFGDITWQKLLSLAIAAGVFVAPKAVDALVEVRAVSRECALSYLLDLEA